MITIISKVCVYRHLPLSIFRINGFATAQVAVNCSMFSPYLPYVTFLGCFFFFSYHLEQLQCMNLSMTLPKLFAWHKKSGSTARSMYFHFYTFGLSLDKVKAGFFILVQFLQKALKQLQLFHYSASTRKSPLLCVVSSCSWQQYTNILLHTSTYFKSKGHLTFRERSINFSQLLCLVG